MLGTKVFVTDPKLKEIKSGIIVGKFISETGYELADVLFDDNIKKRIETAHVYETEEVAKEHLDRVVPIVEQADQIIKNATEMVNELRFQVIGTPDFKELAERIKG